MLDFPSADLLKCGSCCTEFPLSDIVVFIQHKTKPCKLNNSLRCSSCSETFRSAHSLLKHAQFTHKINIFIENNTNSIDEIRTQNEIFIDVISASSTNSNTGTTNSSSTPNYHSQSIEKQLFDITVSTSPSSSNSSSSSSSSSTSSSDKIMYAHETTPIKTECTSQHLVYQNESTSSSSISSASSSIDLITNIKFENQSSALSPSNLVQQHQLQLQQQQQSTQQANEITSLISSSLDANMSTPGKRTKTVSTSSDDKRREKKPKQTASFYCDICHAAFNQKIHLTKHSAKHTGIKPFKCSECNYSTVERSHLKVHVRVHTGEKPFKCSFCEYATAQSSTLKIHKKRHHSLSLLGASNDISKSQNSSTKCPIYSNNTSGEMQLDQLECENSKKRSKYDLKLRDQAKSTYSVELNQPHEFKQDVMIISFEGSPTLHNSGISPGNTNTISKKILVTSMLESSLSKQLTESENKLLGLANIALERETS